MNKYVVAYFSCHSGEITMEQITAVSRIDAAHKYLGLKSREKEEFSDFKKLIKYLGDDNYINVLEVDKKDPGKWPGELLEPRVSIQ